MQDERRRYDPAEFLARLNEAISVKKLEPKTVHHRTGIPYDQLDRLGTGPRGPTAEKLKGLVVGLEVDASFLLDTDERYRKMTPIQRMANMALDRYLLNRELEGKLVGESEVAELRHVAYQSAAPPLWSVDWEIHHERMRVAADVRPEPEPARPEPATRFRRRRGLQ
jgi:hypothetical protein